jgi:hypothetical protein
MSSKAMSLSTSFAHASPSASTILASYLDESPPIFYRKRKNEDLPVRYYHVICEDTDLGTSGQVWLAVGDRRMSRPWILSSGQDGKCVVNSVSLQP